MIGTEYLRLRLHGGFPLFATTPRIGRMQFAPTVGYSLLSGVFGMFGSLWVRFLFLWFLVGRNIFRPYVSTVLGKHIGLPLRLP